VGENTTIAWTNHTFNPWRGCTKISAGCAHCYAEAMSFRNPGVLGVWGDNGTRVVAAESMWRQPLKWDREAGKAGERRRVFCASLGDVFEDWVDLVNPRIRLFGLIQSTPNLDWLLLTKRPENVKPWLEGARLQRLWPLSNVWLGVSVEHQAAADERIPILLSIPAQVRFLSMEPLLGPVNLDSIRRQLPDSIGVVRGGVLGDTDGRMFSPRGAKGFGIDWVIVGGESGPKARPFDLAWARSIRDQCKSAGVPCFVKQLGENPVGLGLAGAWPIGWTEWPEDLRIREFPAAHLAVHRVR
jgi:protein gp37